MEIYFYKNTYYNIKKNHYNLNNFINFMKMQTISSWIKALSSYVEYISSN